MTGTEFERLFAHLRQEPGLETWLEGLPSLLQRSLAPGCHGEMEKWRTAYEAMPRIRASGYDLNRACIGIGTADDCDDQTRQALAGSLMQLHPWRKGPFALFGLHIDTEWRSDWKWQRLAPHLGSLANRRVLDVGCGNGYYLLRMLGQGARLVIGLDPSLRYFMQFRALTRYLPELPGFVLPLGIEALPAGMAAFDTVFSMGVLYHRRSPLDHLVELREALRPGGELVLETLVVPGGANEVLLPAGRYARMRNVWFIPSVDALLGWLRRCGFEAVEVVDVTPTGIDEQRRTDWMRFHSLAEFLDPDDPARTVEGYPAPVRAIVMARRPE